MGQPARVLLVGKDDAENQLSHSLRLCGWDCVEVDPEDTPGDILGPNRPDVVVLNLLNELGRRAPRDFVNFARALRQVPGGLRMPVMMVGDRRAEHTSCALTAAAQADVDDVMLRPVSEMQIAGRLKALLRLKTMHEELVRRLETTSRYGIDSPAVVPQAAAVDDAEVLVVGAGKLHSLFEKALASTATLTGALTHDTALDYLGRRRFDIVIVDTEGEGAAAEDFCRRCRADSRLYNVPVVLIAEPGIIPEASGAFASGITDLLETPIQPEELKVRVMALVREVRFREAMRRVYKEFRHHVTGDALSGLYTRGFALEHMRAMVRAAETGGATFSLFFGRIRNMHEINTLYGYAVGDRIIRQVGDLIGLLMRGEDLSARYRGASFITLLPDTSFNAARVAVARISGIVNHTDFTIPEISSPLPVVFATATGEFEPGDTPERMVDRVEALSEM